jgi:hypothetical protein
MDRVVDKLPKFKLIDFETERAGRAPFEQAAKAMLQELLDEIDAGEVSIEQECIVIFINDAGELEWRLNKMTGATAVGLATLFQHALVEEYAGE